MNKSFVKFDEQKKSITVVTTKMEIDRLKSIAQWRHKNANGEKTYLANLQDILNGWR